MPQTPESLARVRDYAASLPAELVSGVRVVAFRSPLDNYEPVPRAQAYGYAVAYTTDGAERYAVWRDDFGSTGSRYVDELHKALFLIDDGRSVVPHYVAGWGPHDQPKAVFLHPFPTDYDANGAPRLMGDGSGRHVDFGTWALGPRVAYHLKVSALECTQCGPGHVGADGLCERHGKPVAPHVCGYCGGEAVPGDKPGAWVVHATDGERIPVGSISPGNTVSARHNYAGTPIFPEDLITRKEYEATD